MEKRAPLYPKKDTQNPLGIEMGRQPFNMNMEVN